VARLVSLGCIVECDGTYLALQFASRVRRADVIRFVRLNGKPVVLDPATQVERTWRFMLKLEPRTTYTVHVDPGLRDIYDRPLEGSREIAAVTGDFAARVVYPLGIITLSRSDASSFPLRSRNVRSVRVIAFRVPDSVRVTVTSMAVGVYDQTRIVRGLAAETTLVTLPDRLNVDTTTQIPLPSVALAPDHPMIAVRIVIAERLPEAYADDVYRTKHMLLIDGPQRAMSWMSLYTLLQVTDLAFTARLVGAADGSAF